MIKERSFLDSLVAVHIFMCSLKEVPEMWEECKTEMECILFLIKNMDNMDK